jgi:D-alanyl-D-alanine carboxypeptidase
VIHRRSLAELERIPPSARKEGGGAGLYRTSIDGRTAWFHAGFWGTIALEIPAERVTVTVSMGQAQTPAALFQLAGRLAETAVSQPR